MKTLFKIVAGAIGLVVVLFVVAAIAIPLLFDPNDYKDEIVAAVKDRTGRALRIEGDLGLSVFPWIGVDIGTVELGNAPGFPEPFFARVEKVNVRVKLMPLLDRRVEMDKITVHGLALNLAKDAKGKTNWDDLAGAGGGAGAPAPSKPSGGGAGVELASLAIGGLDVRDAQVSWSDATTGRKMAIDRLDLVTGDITGGKPVDVDLKADLSGAELPGGKAKLSLTGKLTADPAAQSVQIADLVLEALDLKVTGDLAASGAGGGKIDGALKVAEFNPKAFAKALAGADIATTDPKALTKLSLDAKLAGSASAVSIDPLAIRLDDSTLSGKAAITDVAKQALRFALSLDAIDVDRYLPPAAAGEGGAAPAAGGAAPKSGGGLPMEQLRALDVDGSFAIGNLKVAKATMTDVDVKLLAKGGVIKLSPIAAKLYEGTYAGDITLDARKDTPHISANERLAGVQALPLLKDVADTDKLSGTAKVEAKVTAVGADADAIKKTLNGTVGFAFENGALNGVNVARMIREATAKIQGKSLPADKEELKTDFSTLGGTVVFKNGVGRNDDFAAQSPLLRIAGKGTADLPKETIDYRTTVTLVASAEGQGGKGLTDLTGVPIPLRITGTFKEPSYGLDTEQLAKIVVESKGKELIGGTVEKATGGALGGILGGAAAGGTTSKTTEAPKESGTTKSTNPLDAVKKGLGGLLGN